MPNHAGADDIPGHHVNLSGTPTPVRERARRRGFSDPAVPRPPASKRNGPWQAPLCSYARLAAVMLLVVMRAAASAQDVTEPALKAAYIYNFALFTQWPADLVPAGAPLVMCVVGDADVRTALERVVGQRQLGGRAVAVADPTPSPQRGCHVLYVSGRTSEEAGRLIAGLRDSPVLTISDLEGFTARGGVAEFFFDQGRLRFTVHLEAARRAHLQISSRLLTLAKQR